MPTNLRPKIYSASKIWNAPRWTYLRDTLGFNINASWIDIPCGTPKTLEPWELEKLTLPVSTTPLELTEAEKTKLWLACSRESSTCDFMVVYAEEGDEMRGALVEMGAALAHFRPVYVIGDCETFRAAAHSDVAFMYHPMVKRLHKVNWLEGYNEAEAHYFQNRIVMAA